MIYDSEQQSIRNALRDSRIEALTLFLGDFIKLLASEGFSIEDLLDALVKNLEQKTVPDSAIKHLEEAAIELSRFSKTESLTTSPTERENHYHHPTIVEWFFVGEDNRFCSYTNSPT